jgi:hypothetical protein
MSRVHWRWAEKDFGFRFRSGGGKAKADFYQASEPGAFYTVPAKHRKLSKERIEELAAAAPPTSPRVVPIPWQNYEREWDWIESGHGILLNFAGCLDREEIHRREDEGVARAMELVASYLDRAEPVALTTTVIQQGSRRADGRHLPLCRPVAHGFAPQRCQGPTKWPLPPGGIEPQMAVMERDIFSRSPFVSEDDEQCLRVRRSGDGRTHRAASIS